MASAFDRNAQHENPRAKITAGIERMSTVFRAALWEEAKQYNLSPLQVQILLFVAFHDVKQCGITSLAREFAVTKATVSDAVKSLVEKSLLKKLDTADARAFLLALTGEGKKCVGKLSGLSDFFTSALENIPEAEINKIWEGMVLLMGHMQKTGIVPLRMCSNCQHFGKNHPDGAPHYCELMQKPLAVNELRIDCPEYISATL